MMGSVETYLRRGEWRLRQWVLDPKVRNVARILAYAAGGFFLSAASLDNSPQPLAMGLICGLAGWRALVACVGSMLGYRVFWGAVGVQGIVWAAAGAGIALGLGSRKAAGEQPLLVPAAAALAAAVTGLVFQLWLGDNAPIGIYLLRVGLAAAGAGLFCREMQRRSAITDWLTVGAATLALAQVAPVPWLGLGYIATGFLAVGSVFPATILAGLGLDLAGVTRVPMTAVLCVAFFLRMIPFQAKWPRYAAPGTAYLTVMALCGIWDVMPLPGLILGGLLSIVVPQRPELARRRGETGMAQVRLEMMAGVLSQTQQMILETAPPPIDEEALLQKARQRACGTCSARSVCREQENLSPELLDYPLDFSCRKTGRILAELRRSQEQLREIKADRDRLREYRAALVQQYQFLSEYLRRLSDDLARRGERITARYRVTVSARTAGKERANGDRCLAFPGTGCRYYVLLCDGMGTGLGAAQEGQSAGTLLQQMLTAGFPAEHALRSINSILALRGQAGAVTMDLAELRLDSGKAAIYKWGAAPSWVLKRDGVEKIGTATSPPGISVTEIRETVLRLSLRRGEALILLSDGVDGEAALRRAGLTPDAPPGELAEKLLERGCGKGEDDATAAVIRLHPTSLST